MRKEIVDGDADGDGGDFFDAEGFHGVFALILAGIYAKGNEVVVLISE